MLGGYAAIADAILKVLAVIAFMSLVFSTRIIEVVSAVVSAYIFWAFRKLLKEISDVPEKIADSLVCLNICLAGVMFMSFAMNSLYDATDGHAHASTWLIDLLKFPIRLGLGITFLAFSFNLFQSRAGLLGMRKPIAWAAGVAGIGYGTSWVPSWGLGSLTVAMLGTGVLDILMGALFFRAAQGVERAPGVQNGA